MSSRSDLTFFMSLVGGMIVILYFWIMTIVISKSDEVSMYSEEEDGDGGHFSACLFPN